MTGARVGAVKQDRRTVVSTLSTGRAGTPRWIIAAVLLIVSALTAALVATNSWRFAEPAQGPLVDDLLLSSDTNAPVPSVRVASFNLLGYGHTKPGGDAPRFEDGITRTDYAVEVLDRRGIEVVGFQEFQDEQYKRFFEIVGTAWNVYPGNQLSSAAMHNSIAWRTEKWALVSARSIPIVYAYGAWIKMPFVLLQHKESGRMVWFANFHNAYGRTAEAQRYRDQARELQIGLANRLWETGVPLVLTGDMNERETYFCPMTSLAPMKSAAGGSYGAGVPCTPPEDMRIDQIFGSPYLQFSNYKAAEGPLIRKTTDHPLVYADVSVPVRRRP
jgi:endonuclease/exonuclease/phosphatase family metal-dependent hydrolase